MERSYSRRLLSKIIFILILFIYKVSLDFSYIYLVSPNYSYSGLYVDVNHFKVIESYAILLVCGLLLKHKINKPSEFFILFLFSMLVVPLLSVYSLQNKSREYLYMVLVSIFVIRLISMIPQVRLPLLKNGDKIALIISYTVGILLFIWIILRGGFSYLNFNIFKVYGLRKTVSEMIFPDKLAYIMAWFGKVMNPVLIAYYFWRRNKKMIVFTIGIQVLFFAITAHKAMLFYPILIVFAFMFRDNKLFGLMVPIGLFGITTISSFYYLITNRLTLITLFVRRVFFVTANNHYRYYDTFKELGFIYLSNKSWFPKIIDYPFAYPTPQVISKIYYGHTNTWINTGFLATGYINFGFLGMLIYSIIIGIIFRYIDYIAKNYLPLWLCISIMIVPIYNLLNSDLPTALLTHGIFIAMIMLWLMSSSVLDGNISKSNYLNR